MSQPHHQAEALTWAWGLTVGRTSWGLLLAPAQTPWESRFWLKACWGSIDTEGFWGRGACHMVVRPPPIPGLETPSGQKGWEQEAASAGGHVLSQPTAGLADRVDPGWTNDHSNGTVAGL